MFESFEKKIVGKRKLDFFLFIILFLLILLSCFIFFLNNSFFFFVLFLVFLIFVIFCASEVFFFMDGTRNFFNITNCSVLIRKETAHYYFKIKSDERSIFDPIPGVWEFDDRGLPSHDKINGKFRHSPISISQYALASLNSFLDSGILSYRDIFLKCVLWISENKHLKVSMGNQYLVWYVEYPWSQMKADKWISGMAQGEVISVLTRAFLMTGDQEYLKLAKQAFCSFLVNVEKGGIIYEELGKDCIIEEYPERPYSHVLNGWIFGLIGLYDLWRVTNDKDVKMVFDKSVLTLTARLPRYDCGFWSYYDDPATGYVRGMADMKYHFIHLKQLELLFSLTGKREFLTFAQKFERYFRSPMCILKFIIFSKFQKFERFYKREILRNV